MMDQVLYCEETLSNSPGGLLGRDDMSELLPQFCSAPRDRALADDERVLANMLSLEHHYSADLSSSYGKSTSPQDEIELRMRGVVAEWMLEVCADQRCHPDVFLLATNIIDRFLAAIRLRKKQFQLLGAAAIFLASKLVESSPIPAITLVRYTADTYDKEELLSMELLILSKLKWDLMAITAYDFLDHILERLQRSSPFDSSQCDSLKRHTERLVSLCATDAAFVETPPSVVASAAVASALQQDFESQPPEGPSSLAEIFARLRKLTRIEMERLQDCIDRIEELFVSGVGNSSSSSQLDTTTESNPANISSEGFHSSPDRQEHPSPKMQKREENKTKMDEDRNATKASTSTTPTGVFDVSALCVT